MDIPSCVRYNGEVGGGGGKGIFEEESGSDAWVASSLFFLPCLRLRFSLSFSWVLSWERDFPVAFNSGTREVEGMGEEEGEFEEEENDTDADPPVETGVTDVEGVPALEKDKILG